MPPKRSQKAQKSIEQEGRMLLAMKAIQNGRITTIAAAARSFDVPRTTLANRLKGTPNLYEARGTGYKFTQLEEESIQDWLISMDQRGAALTIAMLKDMANLLLKHRGDDTPKTALNVSSNGWTSNEISIDWLQKHFIPHTTSQTKGKYYLLVLDGHNSHLTATFDKIYQENNIIPICIDSIEKDDFLDIFPAARDHSFKEAII
ncbi:DDE superfamily endonuclease, CENP-B-like [Penicillium camemberti]|uniref:DDE superfamily endonuclease, CENP-B-like n=1 Tax=Penicillium camemberti (strain FM 013) TaxID=1429867 RepID=A0A0G4PW70_PENC3|nr:DDE superfamily endonuclease, CENP-B-like [Penicillium camemberti]